MNKIEIKLNHVSLEALCDVLEDSHLHLIWTHEQKAVSSIMIDLMKQLLKKEIDKRHTVKKFKMSLKYHEAFALEKACRMIYQNNAGGVYEVHTALNIANQIHAQL